MFLSFFFNKRKERERKENKIEKKGLLKCYLLRLPNYTFKITTHQKRDLCIELVHFVFSVQE